MEDRSKTSLRGTRTVENWTKGPGSSGWTVNKTVSTNLFNESESFSCINGTGGDPQRKIPTSYSFSKDRTVVGSGSMTSGDLSQNYQSIVGCTTGSGMDPTGPTPNLDGSYTNIQNRALAKLSERTRGSLDLAIDLLEGRQTARMLRNAARLQSYILSFSPRRWASKWLEYQYGWRPLASSVYQGARLLTSPRNEGIASFSARESETLYGRVSNTSNGIVTSCDSVLFKRFQVVVKLDFSGGTLETLSQMSSLNPASIAWELLPYSFVADWFVNIGGYLRTMETALLQDLQFKYGYMTTGSLRIDDYRKSGSQKTGPSSYTTISGGQNIHRRTTKSRTKLSSYPTPLFPSLKVDLGSERILSGAALLRQFFAKGRG